MTKRAKFSDEEWYRICQRVDRGEAITAVAKEFGISDAAIRKRREWYKDRTINLVANQLVTAEVLYNELPTNLKVEVRTLADRLKLVTTHLFDAAINGAMTASRLSQYAHTATDKIDSVDPITSMAELQAIAALTQTANEAGRAGMKLIELSRNNAIESISGEKEEKVIRVVNSPDA